MVVVAKPLKEQKVAETVVRPRVINGVETEAEAAPLPTGINEAVERIASEHSLPPQLIHSVIKVESNYNPYAVSVKGAQGLMQLIPDTAHRFGVRDAFNPVENIQGGAKYLRYLLDLYDGNYPLALAAYNAGEAAVAKYGGIPPYAETQNYVTQVRRQLEIAKKAAAAKPQAAPPPTPQPKGDGPASIMEERQPDGSIRYVSR
jgi:soluble lytic murein transglycosylase-like protein